MREVIPPYTGKVALMSLHDESSWLLPKSSPLQPPEDQASLVELALPFLTLTLTLLHLPPTLLHSTYNYISLPTYTHLLFTHITLLYLPQYST